LRLEEQADMLSGAQDLRVIIQRGYALCGEVLKKQTHLPALRYSSLEENQGKNTLCVSGLYVVRKVKKVKQNIEIKNPIHTFPLLRRYLPQGRI
jgi:hypothetical protein